MTSNGCRPLAVFALLLVAGPAHASPSYPAALQEALDLACPPKCTICHKTMEGGFATVIQPFGQALIRIARLEGKHPEKVPAALDAVEAALVDSDGDDVADIDELRADTDPSGRDAPLECMEEEKKESGCSVATGWERGRHGGWNGWAGAGAALAFVALRSRRLRVRARSLHQSAAWQPFTRRVG